MPSASSAPSVTSTPTVRRPVYLPENRHHWVTNNDVQKPLIDVRRGPIRPKIPTAKTAKPAITSAEWMRTYLPRIGATAIVAIVILGIVAVIYTDLAVLF